MLPRVAVTVLFNRSCPSHEAGLVLLHSAAQAAKVALDISLREVLTDEEARDLAFPGSPTFYLNGTDPWGAASHSPCTADACRAFARSDGTVSPLPSLDMLTRALTAALQRGA